MTTLKHLSISFLAGWLAAWTVLFGMLIADSIELIIREGDWARLGEGALAVVGYTLPVVAIAWLLVAAPYYLCCIRKGSPRSKFKHCLITSGFAIACSGLVSGGSPEMWVVIGIPAVLSAITGTLTLLRLTKSTLKNQTSNITDPSI